MTKKIILAHVVHSPGVEQWYAEVADAAGSEVDVTRFCVTLAPPGPRLTWRELDRRWRRKDRALMEMYERLRDATAQADVLLVYNGANIHPELLSSLSTFNVFSCFDDPESSGDLSEPVAAAFDAVFFGNISSRFQYESWGCTKLAWLPVFTAPSDVPAPEEGERLLSAARDVEISFVGERNHYRSRRLEALVGAFPAATCVGSGWGAGRIDEPAIRDLYRRTKIGWNIHNSTGPINRRLFALPAHGALQLCDNKTGLGQIFRLGEEAIGFDTIPEAIELTRHFLEHDDERARVAEGGFRRFWRDYHPAEVWRRIAEQIDAWTAAETVDREVIELRRKPRVSEVLQPGYRWARSTAGVLRRKLVEAAVECRHQGAASEQMRDERAYLEERVAAYVENDEMRGVNMALVRLARGEPFEWPNIVALNWAVTALIRNARNIVEIGSGTGPFAHLAAVDPKRRIDCVEEDDFAREWAREHRSHPNVSYWKSLPPNILGGFDLLVAIDVIEHVDDMRSFLTSCASLARRAVFSTPNRVVVRGPNDVGPPPYPPHVREFAAGEFYWILRQYYHDIALYHMPDIFVPWLAPMTIPTHGTPIIADCRSPIMGEESRGRSPAGDSPGRKGAQAADDRTCDSGSAAEAGLSR